MRSIDRAYRLAWPLAVMAFAAGCAWVQFQAALLPEHRVYGLCLVGFTAFLFGSRGVLRWQRGLRTPWLGVQFFIGLLGAALLGAGWASLYGAQKISQGWASELEGKNIEITGYVATLPAKVSGGQRFQFVIERSGHGESLVGKRLALSWYGDHALLKPAQRYRLTIRAKQRHGAQNPHGFDYELWLVQRGIAATGYVRESPQDEGTQVRAFLPWVERVRGAIRDALFEAAPNERAARWAAALALGDQRSLNEVDWQRYNGTGTGHLLAVSGSHIMMMGALLAWLAGRWWSSKPARLLILERHRLQQHVMLMSCIMYALIAGWELPAQRTVLMLGVAWLAYRFSARSAVWHVMACAGAVALCLDPMAVISPSFWFSYGAVAVLLSLNTPSPNAVEVSLRHNAPNPETLSAKPNASQARWAALRLAVKTQWYLTLALLPLGAVFFSQVSWVSPFANAFAIPIMGWFSTPLALLAGVLSLLWRGMATALMQALLAVQYSVDAALDVLLKIPYAYTTVPQMPWIVVATSLLAALGCIVFRGRARQIAALAAACCTVVAAFMPQLIQSAPRGWQVVFLDVGQGMAVAVHSQGKTLLFDAGPRYGLDSDGAARIILPYLNAKGVRVLDHVVLSHADEDHTGGVRSVLARLPVGQWWASLPAKHPLHDLLPTHTQPCLAGQSLRWAGLHLQWLHPLSIEANASAKTNAMSCALRISDERGSVLLAGDIEAAQEEALVLALGERLRSQILLSPHHGSKTSSTAAFLDVVAPQHVVMQMGYRNRFGHPHPSVVARYQAQSIVQWRSDADGAVIAHFDEAGLTMKAWRQTARRYWHTSMPETRSRGAHGDGEEF